MVVNWTGTKPDREGFWLIAFKWKYVDRYTPKVIEVITVKGELCVHEGWLPRYYTVDDLFEGKHEFNLKCSASPIQIDNIDWDYKYQESKD